MDPEDVIYLVALIISVGLGYIFQNIRNIIAKKWFSTITGLIITILVCRGHVLHTLISTLLMGLAIKRRIVSFVIGFGYLIFFRSAEYFGIPAPPGHANMVQMILTLKLIGLAFEIHDNNVLAKKLETRSAEIKDEDLYRHFPSPTMQDVFHYTFCYAGVLTGKLNPYAFFNINSFNFESMVFVLLSGPYFTFRTYLDVFRYPRADTKACFKEAVRTTMYIPALAVLHLVISTIFPLQVRIIFKTVG